MSENERARHAANVTGANDQPGGEITGENTRHPCPRCGHPKPYPTTLDVLRYPPTGRPDLWVRYGPDGPPGWGDQ